MPRATKTRKLLMGDLEISLHVTPDTTLDPKEILQKGEVAAIRKGSGRRLNVFGDPIGKSGINVIRPMEIEQSPEHQRLIAEAIERTKADMKHETQRRQGLLPQITVITHRQKKIERGDEPFPRYFIKAHVQCDNCTEPIPGTHTLEINKYGKVAGESPFIPDDPDVKPARPGSKKLVHPQCAATSIRPETNEETWQPPPAKQQPQAEQLLLDLILNMLEDHNISAEFRAGAAWSYLLRQKLTSIQLP